MRAPLTEERNLSNETRKGPDEGSTPCPPIPLPLDQERREGAELREDYRWFFVIATEGGVILRRKGEYDRGLRSPNTSGKGGRGEEGRHRPVARSICTWTKKVQRLTERLPQGRHWSGKKKGTLRKIDKHWRQSRSE